MITANISNAQNAQELIDGLKKELQTNPDEKRTATIYSDLTWYYSSVNTDSALVYGNKALIQSKKINDSTLIAQVFSDIGNVYFRRDNIESSMQSYLNALKIRKKLKDENGVAKINLNIANLYQAQEKFKPATQAYLSAMIFFQKTNNLKALNVTKGNLASLFYKIKNYPKSLKYLNESIKYQEENNLAIDLCKSYLTLGNVYLSMKDTLLSMKMYDKSLIYCNKIGDKYAISSIYNNIGLIKVEQNRSKEAKKIFAKAKEYREDLKSNVYKAKLELNTVDELIHSKKYLQAKSLLDDLKYVFRKNDSKLNLLNTYKGYTVVFSFLKMPDSTYYYSKKINALETEIYENSSAKENNELETKYQTAKKEQEIAEKNNQIIIASIVALAFLAFGFLLYINQKTKNKQQKQESALKEALLKVENENQLQEQRLSISKELHDNIGSQLTFVISSIDTLKQNYPSTNEKIDSQLENINTFTKNTITELRDTVWVMNTKDINGDALKERLLENMERAKMTYPNINFKVDIDSFSIDNSVVALNMFRAIQEAINNALKYAKATEIEVGIHQQNNQIDAFVKDNGLGFDPETIKKGNGLKNMKKRIQSVGGDFSLTSQQKLGTQIIISIPNTI